MIRSLEFSDVDNLVDFCERCYMETSYKNKYKFNKDTVKTELYRSLLDNNKLVFINLTNEIIDGVIGFVLYTSYYDGELHAQEHTWHGDPSYSSFKKGKIMINLLSHALNIIKNKAIKSITIGTSPDNGYSKYLNKLGFTCMQHNFVKVVA